MAEIARPVRVEGYLENEGNDADLFCVRDADGGYVAMVLPKEAADQITAAINEHAALRAQVARVRALAERLQRGWHGACHYGLDWREGEIVREVGRELLATIDGEGGAS